jgi:type VI secretion system protein ImpJ
LDWLSQLLVRSRGELRSFLGSAQGNLLRKDQLTNARRAYCEVRGLEEMLHELREGGIHPHPYVLFGALRRLYFEICCYRQVEPADTLPAYRHDDPGATLDDWLTLFNANFHDSRNVFRPTVKAFERQEDRFVIELGKDKEDELDPLLNEFYLLVKRKDPSAPPRSLEKVKLASPDRLADVRRRALKGIPVQPATPPGFAHDIPLDFDWHPIRAEGEEWAQALRKKGLALAFYVTPALDDAEVSLFWRGV